MATIYNEVYCHRFLLYLSVDAKRDLDSIDLGLLGRLARDGRSTWKDLGAEFGLTSPAPEPLGAVTAFAELTLDDPQTQEDFRQAVGRLVAVQECHRVAGTAQYLLKVRARSTAELDGLLGSVLPSAVRGASIRVSVVLSTIKESPVFPLPK
jgi:Lrp/AsnC family transcriptional regulator, leucine-responsive regulatory protein